MTGSVRAYLSSGVVMAFIGAMMYAPVVAEPGVQRDGVAVPRRLDVAVSSQVQPLVIVTPLPSPQEVVALLDQQVAFHTDFLVDFVTQGAQLVQRQIPVPGTLLQDIQSGTPLPAAVSKAVSTLTDVEVDAGRRLVGFATRYVDFQVRFVITVVQDAVAVATAVPVAASQFVASTMSTAMPRTQLAVPEKTDAVETLSTARQVKAEPSDVDDSDRHGAHKTKVANDETASGTTEMTHDGNPTSAEPSSTTADESGADGSAVDKTARDESRKHQTHDAESASDTALSLSSSLSSSSASDSRSDSSADSAER